MKRRKVANNPKGSSKIHGIAMFDETWRQFKEFKDYYDLPGDAAIAVLLDNWNPMGLNPDTDKFLRENARHTKKELTTEQKIKKAKMMSSHNALVKNKLIVDRSTLDSNKDIFNDHIDYDQFI